MNQDLGGRAQIHITILLLLMTIISNHLTLCNRMIDHS